ncbi:MAG: dihydroxyacetone kinase subunit DhaK, partial [Propionibacterium freudenreichii]
MTYLVNDPKQFAADSLTGMVAANEDYLTEVHGGVTRATDSPQGEVAVIVGGGSGHYPAFAGWVGPGMAHGAVCGNIFASPSASQVESVVRASDHGGGAVLLFGNYAGDRLQFGAAQSPLGADGIDTRIVTISDDIASDTPQNWKDRRGIAGDLSGLKKVTTFVGTREIFLPDNALFHAKL